MADVRRRLRVNGIVQGVGFRPFVFNLAESLDLSGFVTNTSSGVVIEIQGAAADLDLFSLRLCDEVPPLARIVSATSEDLRPRQEAGFAIGASVNAPGTDTLVSPDVATCDDCLREIRDPGDRRHGYPFTNCTNCGPRWTIIERIPYDRPFTSMAPFAMCPDCTREYVDPRDRRFHAQPNACPACGPQLWLEDECGRVTGEALQEAAALLAAGRILAVKGLGGFHLAVRADDEAAVTRLRESKRREAKPLAVMTRNLAGCRQLAHMSPAEETALTSHAAPIVLLDRRAGAPVAAAVAAGHRRLGVMLPYTPLHHLLLDALAEHGIDTLVMTSGNAGSEPICLDNDHARRLLRGIADAWLLHDRGIVRRADDSVLMVPPGENKPVFFRRSRGFAPVPVPVLLGDDHRDDPEILAVGPHLKNTICVLKRGRAFLSPHVGDLENPQANAFFTETVTTLTGLLECDPRVIAHDMHPDYFSTRWARELAEVELVPVQHHHAHLAAVLAENGHAAPAVGLILDGTGYGADGTIWGGEILVGDAAAFTRAAHLETVPLPGGDAAARQPWRMAVSWLLREFGSDRSRWPALPFLKRHPVPEVLEMIAKDINCPVTSSCGRLFDAVAALTGRWDIAHYEAQAAIEFMALTTAAEVAEARPFPLTDEPLTGDVIPAAGLVRECAKALAKGIAAETISARFHRTLIDRLAAATVAVASAADLSTVALGGGVFQNEIMLAGLARALQEAGLDVLRPVELPPGDGAVALGQAVVARTFLRMRA
ncbi:carbamoyltransferase HypF [bacterium CG17_big_fil_post_rev_8_21_14_2_50_64_8]|nr:MAG: carbamoyltransferase HypF [bacterium CG17_big_fil_post_rev_8_21_14_2_50_64_8]PJA74764.1 MAG: carbamoyltransferase HypF [bacterium CG_4_9_14_3_um_filter_65_15]